MFDLIQKYFSKGRTDKRQLRTNFTHYFFALPEHEWLNLPAIRSHFDQLFLHLPAGLLETMMNQYPVTFIQSETLRTQRQTGIALNNTIVVFPEFQKLLLTDKKAAVAYLAHEVAFLLYELDGDKNDPLMAEVEADKFVCDVGLENELEELLLMLDETIEKRLRLTYLTINHFTKSDN